MKTRTNFVNRLFDYRLTSLVSTVHIVHCALRVGQIPLKTT